MSFFDKIEPHFYKTAPVPCSYLAGQFERKVVTQLVSNDAVSLYNNLSINGFRRSQSIAYRPDCDFCNACVSLRIPVADFKPNKTQKRILTRNNNLVGKVVTRRPTSEQYSLFRDYISARHESGGMSDMTMLDYTLMTEESYVDTRIIEYRERGVDSFITKSGQGKLKAVSITDFLEDGLSMVYTFFDSEDENRSLGTMMILDHIERAKNLGLPYVYLGFWIKNSPKMAYKANFKPHEIFVKGEWMLVE
jgi:leucyl-tRNA---protein transferase